MKMKQVVINKQNIRINFGDKVWSTDEDFNGGWPWGLVGVVNGIENTVTFDGEKGGIDVFSNYKGFNCYSDYRMAITVGSNGANGKKGHLVIEGGVYKSLGSHCVYVMNGLCEIKGGFFFTQPSSDTPVKSEAEREKYGECRNFLLNLWDTNGKNGNAKIKVTGGSFVGFDPADNYAEGDGTNFVGVGYKSVKNGEYTYRVKDSYSKYDKELVTVPVYTVVPENDPRDGISGIIE